MEDNTNEQTVQKAAKTAGFLFLLVVIGSIIYGVLVLFRLDVPGDPLSTAQNIMANKRLFGIGITWELITSALTAGLGLTLYVMLKSVNKNFALLGLLLKLVEAALVAMLALGSFTASLILNSQTSLSVFSPEQLQTIVGWLMNEQTNLHAVPMFFLGMNFMLFFVLLCRSEYVPRILARFGILSYLMILIFAVITILAPHYPTAATQAFFWGPSIIFELVIGIWLLTKGLKIPQKITREHD